VHQGNLDDRWTLPKTVPIQRVIVHYMATFVASQQATTILTQVESRRGSGESLHGIRVPSRDCQEASFRDPQWRCPTTCGSISCERGHPVSLLRLTVVHRNWHAHNETGTWHHGIAIPEITPGGHVTLKLDFAAPHALTVSALTIGISGKGFMLYDNLDMPQGLTLRRQTSLLRPQSYTYYASGFFPSR